MSDPGAIIGAAFGEVLSEQREEAALARYRKALAALQAIPNGAAGYDAEWAEYEAAVEALRVARGEEGDAA